MIAIREDDSPINTPYKCICSKKPNSASEKPVHSARQQAVAEEEHAGNEAVDVELGKVVPHAVAEYPECTTSANKEGLPPPMVVLG